MKKLLCILLALLMMCSSALADSIIFKTPISSDLDYSTSTIMAALCEVTTITLYYDILLADEDIFYDITLGEPSYVGARGNTIFVYMQGKNSDYSIRYTPGSSEAELFFAAQGSPETIAFIMQTLCPDGYVQNSYDTLWDLYQEAEEIF